MRHDMLYLRQNAEIPFNTVTSTARKGKKWLKASPGDKLIFRFTQDNKRFGSAIVTKVEVVSWDELIARSNENYAGGELETALIIAYGPNAKHDDWTMVHFIRPGVDARDLAYWAIDTERDYQDKKVFEAGGNLKDRRHEVAAMLTYMRSYLTEAEHIASHSWGPDADLKTLEFVRKVTALGVSCLEYADHVPFRK